MRQRERGGAVVVVMLVLTATLAASAALAQVQRTSLHATQLTRSTADGLYCAEAGLVAARATVLAHAGGLDAWLGTGTEPGWLSVVDHDLDADGAADFTITLADNDDEAANDLAHDTDGTVYIVSTCIRHPESKTQVTELVTSTGQRKLWMRTE